MMTIDEANERLRAYVPLVSMLTGSDTTLDRIRPLMKQLGDPQNKTNVVHIAGTSGKTSTAYFMSALLVASGKRVGLTVSPHVDSVTERIQIHGLPISDELFCHYLDEFLVIIESLTAKPSYFELLYALSFYVFERERVDYAVVETGMGGLHDATNVVDRPDKLCIITDIGFDHMHILGNTLPEITAQKAGIIQAENQVVMYRQAPEIMKVIEARVDTQYAKLVIAPAVETTASYQQRNWQLAHEAYEVLRHRDHLPELTQAALADTQAIQVPGRMDVRSAAGKTIIMDGAHNAQKMETFVRSLRQRYPNSKPAVLLSLKEGKEPVDILPLITEVASRIIITSFHTSQDLPVHSIDPSELRALFQRAGATDVQAIADMHQAYLQVVAGPEELVVITGSFYLLSQLRKREGLR